jgi:hypothetical protein
MSQRYLFQISGVSKLLEEEKVFPFFWFTLSTEEIVEACLDFHVLQGNHQGPMLWFFNNIFAEKNRRKKLAFLYQNKAKLCKNWIITLVFEKNANFVGENWRKSQKIEIITSTPDMILSNTWTS